MLRRITLAILLQTVPVARADLLTFDQVPYVFAQDPARFQHLWHNAMTQTVRVALLGDSQETSPGGAGRAYIPRFGYELWRHYGNVPETQVVGHSSFGGSSSAEWLLRGSTTGPAPSATRLNPTQILPGISPRAHSTNNSSVNVNGQAYGQLTMLLHDAVLVDSNTQVRRSTNHHVSQFATIFCVAPTSLSSSVAISRPPPHWRWMEHRDQQYVIGKCLQRLECYCRP